MSLPGSSAVLDREAYEDLLDWQLAKIATDPRAVALEQASCAADESYFFARHFKIEDIERPGRLTRLIPKPIQKKLLEEASTFNVVLKSRKPGVSTLIDARAFHRALFRPHRRCVIIAHDREHTGVFMDRIRFAYDNLPDWLKPPADRETRSEVVFRHNGSHIRGLTAGNARIGRGSDIDFLHGTECSIWNDLDAVLLGAGEAMREGGEVWLESTANGREAFMETYCAVRDGRRSGKAFFFAWPADPRNVEPLIGRERIAFDSSLTKAEREVKKSLGLSLEQAKWRRSKVENLEDKFQQEYPENDVDCFLTSGTPKFDAKWWTSLLQVVMERVKRVPPTLIRERFPAFAALGDDPNFVMWQMPRKVCPCCGAPEFYAIGADVAEGVPGGNFSHGGVLRVTHIERCEQVAEWHGHLSPPEWGLRLAVIGNLYNRAIIGVERNNHGHATNYALQRVAEYPTIYRHREFDQRGNGTRKIGFPTTPGTRETLLTRFQQRVKANEHIVRSSLLCRECADFQVGDEDDDDHKGGKKKKRNNDSVFGWAIADWVAVKGAAIPVA